MTLFWLFFFFLINNKFQNLKKIRKICKKKKKKKKRKKTFKGNDVGRMIHTQSESWSNDSTNTWVLS